LVSIRSPSYTASVNFELIFYTIRLGIVRKIFSPPEARFHAPVNCSQTIVEQLFSILHR